MSNPVQTNDRHEAPTGEAANAGKMSPTVDFLYTNIGRGHPFYLDGIRTALGPDRLGSVDTVFDISRGMSRMAWATACAAYHAGSRGGAGSALYSYLRRNTNYNRSSLMMRIMARDVRRHLEDAQGPLVVAHPSLAGMLRGRSALVYQHGELVAPPESFVKGRHYTLVPDSEVADAFLRQGACSDHLVVTGLCVEAGLCLNAEASYAARIERLRGSQPLRLAMFSSGAEPRQHVNVLLAAASSAVRAGASVQVFAHRQGPLFRQLKRSANRDGLRMMQLDASDPITDVTREAGVLLVVSYASRSDLDDATARILPSCDGFVAPSHERTNWGLGLGIPMWIVDPPIGSFSPLNRQRLLTAGVASVLDHMTSTDLGSQITERAHRDTLLRRAEAGFGKRPIGGFQQAAETIEAIAVASDS